MSETSAQEPTMEEILASIRRIISEDDPAAGSEATAAEPAPAAVSEPEPLHAHEPAGQEDDVLDLTDPFTPEPPAAPSLYQAHEEPAAPSTPLYEAPPPEPPPFVAPPPFIAPAPSVASEPLVGSSASEASASHFGALARTIAMPREGRSLEDVVRELLKPMLRDWLDQHLPGIVEARVQAEVERIARRNDY